MKRTVFCFSLALFYFAIAQSAVAMTVPVEAPAASPLNVLQMAVADLVGGAEAVIASIESTVGNLAFAITGHAVVASNTASAAAGVTPSPTTVKMPEAPLVSNSPTSAPPSIPTITQTAPSVPLAPSTGAAPANIFELQSTVSALTQGVRGLTALLAAQTPSSKIESQIAALQSGLSSQGSGQSYNASAYIPLGDGAPNTIAAASNIGQLANATLNNVTVNGVSGLTAAEIPTSIVAANYLPLSGEGALTGDISLAGGVQPSGTPTTVVSDGKYNAFPGITTLPNGHLIVTYYKGSSHIDSNGAVYYRTSANGGATWSNEQQIYGNGARDSEITLLSNSQLLLTFYTYNSGIDTGYTMLGTPNANDTVTWNTPVLLSTSFQYSLPADSKAIQLSNGTLVLPLQVFNNTSNESTMVVTSTNGGNTWGNPVMIASSTAIDEYDEAQGVALPSGRIVIIVRHDAGTTGYARVYSDDNGLTWSQSVNVIPQASNLGKPALTLLPDGTLFLIGRSNTGATFYAWSRDQGVTWSTSYAYLDPRAHVYASDVSLGGNAIASVIALQNNSGSSDIVFQSFTNTPNGVGGGQLSANMLSANSFQGTLGLFSEVAIGITNPSTLLQVGKTSTDSATAATTTSSAYYLGLGGQEYNTGSYRLIGFGYKSQTLLNFPAFMGYQETSSAGATWGDLIFGTRNTTSDVAPTERMRISAAGNVGIGTTTPGSLLSLGGIANFTTATSTLYSTGGINLNGGCFSINGTCIGGGSGSGTVGSGAQGQFAFYNAAGTTLTATSSLFLSQNGNVGIGTVSPTSLLHVSKSQSGVTTLGDSRLLVLADTDGSLGNRVEIGLGYKSVGVTYQPVVIGSQVTNTSNHTMGSFYVATRNVTTDTPPSIALLINSAGAVGIGTTSPATTLSVAGNGYLTGGLGVGLLNTTAGTIQSSGNATIGGCVNYNGGTSGTCLSDERVKQDISPFTDGLQDIIGLNPVTYEYNGLAGTPDDGDIRAGLIAQQVQQVAPDLVSTTSAFLNASDTAPTQLLEVNYSALTFALINAVKEIASISGSFENALVTWLGSASNGIGNLYATVIHATTGYFGQVNANELCLGSTCVTQTQLEALLASANQSASASASLSPSSAEATDTPPVMQLNGDNPATIQVGASYTDLGASITGPQADLNLGIETYLNGMLESLIELDTSVAATDTISYVVTDSQGLTSTSTRTVIVEPAAAPLAPPPTASSAATSSSATSTSQ